MPNQPNRTRSPGAALALALLATLTIDRLAIGQGSAAPAAPAAATAQPVADEPPAGFDAAYLGSVDNILAGQAIWDTQCRHCHGNAAYPGKAPKLRPGVLEPEFIFDRVTYGFRAMPPWRAVFSREQRKAVVAYIKSDRFSP